MNKPNPYGSFVVEKSGLYSINDDFPTPLKAGDKISVCKCGRNFVNSAFPNEDFKSCVKCQMLKLKMEDLCDS